MQIPDRARYKGKVVPDKKKVVPDKQNQNDPGIHGKVPVVAIQTELLRQAK